MDSLHNSDRPISYGSTSSSASSRDSHCSLSGRPVLGPALERDAGAIRLELVPARQLDCADQDKETAEPVDTNTAQTPQGVKVAYVDRVVQEILDTERTYVEDLRSIVQDYLDCIIDQSSLLLGEEDRSSLFGNIRDIYCFNSALLRDLQKCNADPAAIAECFVCIHTPTQTFFTFQIAVCVNKSVVKFLRERQESLKHLLPLGSYLLKPVQRILKYHLLLHEIANHLPKDTEMYDVVLEAIDTMQRVAWHINDMKRKHEHAIRLQEIQSLLTNWKGPDLIGYGELVLEGTFRIQRAKSERTFFLFDKLLLITKKRDETFTYKAHILCCNLMLVELIPKEPLSFSVFHYKNPKLQHTVQAKSQQDKRSWILHLKRLILENHPAKIPAKAKQAILEMDAANHPGFHYSPDENNKSSSHAKEGPSPRRVRRKSEPLSKLLKNSKHSGVDREEGSQQQDADDEDDSGPTLQMDSGHTPILRVTHPLQGEGDTHVTVPNIWADHKVRRAMFPTRQLTTQIDDEEDIYQMFVPTEPVGTEQESDRESNESSGHPGRPCSWHVEQTRMLQLDHHAVVGSKVLRRASSVDPATAMPTHREPESSSNEISGSSSAEQLTLDDVENVYDNISLEELQAMGLVRRESDVNRPVSSEDPGLSQSSTGTSHSSANERSAPDACDLQIVEEENIYDTITFIVPPLPSLSKEVRTERGQTGFMPDTGPATSKESLLQLEEDGKGDCSHPKKTSPPAIMKSGSEKTESTSEKVDEIWNDLENYIRKNERKADKLPAAFPVAGHETTSVVSPRKKQNSKANTSKGNSVSPAIPEPPPVGTVKSIRNKLARLSSGSFRMDDDYDEDLESPRDPPPPIHREELQTLFPGLDASLFPFLSEAGDQFLDLGDKSRNRVFLMARQYSQKIKKANQLMKMKSMDVEPSCARNTRSKSKDLADILEEKKQGGAAIGARIAEYSQLYDHVIFKDSQKTTPKGPGGRPSPGLASSPSLPECSMLDDDWLNSIYSNGQLASTPSSAAEESDQRPQRRLASTTSVPSFQNLLQSPLAQPSQRWSACVTTPTTEDPDHIYSSLGPSSSSPKISPYGRCQSSSSLADQLEKENGGGNCRWDGPKCHTAMSPGKSGCGLGARQSSLPEYPSHFSLSPDPDLTLRDSQQVLLLDRKLPLGTLVATRNYLANFKDNGEDDDYVEIRSEEESKQEQCRTAGDGTRLVQTQSLPCSPARSCHGAAGSVGGRSQLKDYVWQDLEDTSQPNIVQSLREKFRCLSSSSFA
uniref:Pleckstrin homology domain-containing family G member 1 n=1 Tax=Denticeps clupeoides TaxID=299321 RepID=A0AAY4BQQ2_9TELE